LIGGGASDSLATPSLEMPMRQAIGTRTVARIAAGAALCAVLVVPALHGALGHADASCERDAPACRAAAADASLQTGPGSEICPLCLASSARSLLVPGAVPAVTCDDGSARAPVAPDAPAPAAPLARAVSGPRAPPARS
jgi:hypothetical protein